MDNICFIPAKGNSRRLPHKNILPVGGKSLVVRSIESAIGSGCFKKVCVSSDDNEILNEAEQAGATALKRTEEMCRDDVRAKDVVKMHLLEMKGQFDMVSLLMNTNPLRTQQHVKEAYAAFLEKKATCLVSVTEYDMNPGVAFTIEEDRVKPFYGKNLEWVREDIFPKGYHMNGAIFMAQHDFFMKEVTFLNEDTVAYQMDRISSIDVDTLEDLKLAEFYLKNRI